MFECRHDAQRNSFVFWPRNPHNIEIMSKMWRFYSLMFLVVVSSICSVDSSECSQAINSIERKILDLEKFLDMMQAQMLIQSETMKAQFRSLTETMDTGFKSQFDNIKEQMKSQSENLNSQNEKLELKIESINESIATQFNSISDKIDLKIKYQNEKIDDQFISLNDSVQAHIESKIGNIGSKTESLFDSMQILTNNQTEKIESLFESIELQNNNQTALMHNITEEFQVLSSKFKDPSQLIRLITLQYKENTLKCDVQMINSTINSTSNVNQSSVSTIEKVVNKQKPLNEIREAYRKNKYLADDDKNIMLHACEYGETSVVTAILDLGFNIDTYLDSRTCLRVTVDFNRVTLAKVLLARGANMEIGDTSNNYTPLIRAAIGGHLDMVKLLVESGANNLSARSKYLEYTALGQAKEYNRQDVINYLRSKGATE